MKFRFQSIVLATLFFVATSPALGQIDFDSPNVIQTNFTRKMASQYAADQVGSSCEGCHQGGLQQGSIYDGVGVGYAANGCDSCGVGENACGCSSQGGFGYGSYDSSGGGFGSGCEIDSGMDCGGRQFGLTVSGIVDIPMDGVFQTSYDALVTAGTLGVPGGILAGGTPIQMNFIEQGFEDIYDVFGGVQANVNFQLDCNTSMFLGYRYTSGQANQVNVGSAIVTPLSTPIVTPITAQYSEFRESQIQAGFLNSQCMNCNLDFLWGGRIGIGFVDEISATYDIPGYVTLTDVPFYDDSTTMTFGFNFGFQKTFGCHVSAHVLTGIEYRTSLNADNSVLNTYGLGGLNDGSGFASQPIYMGVTYLR